MSVRPGVHVVEYDVAYIPTKLIWSKTLENRQLDLLIKNNKIILYTNNHPPSNKPDAIEGTNKILEYLKEILIEEELLEVEKVLFANHI